MTDYSSYMMIIWTLAALRGHLGIRISYQTQNITRLQMLGVKARTAISINRRPPMPSPSWIELISSPCPPAVATLLRTMPILGLFPGSAAWLLATPTVTPTASTFPGAVPARIGRQVPLRLASPFQEPARERVLRTQSHNRVVQVGLVDAQPKEDSQFLLHLCNVVFVSQSWDRLEGLQLLPDERLPLHRPPEIILNIDDLLNPQSGFVGIVLETTSPMNWLSWTVIAHSLKSLLPSLKERMLHLWEFHGEQVSDEYAKWWNKIDRYVCVCVNVRWISGTWMEE